MTDQPQPPNKLKPPMKRSMSSSHLTKTLATVSPAEFKEARQIMETETQKFQDSLAPVPPAAPPPLVPANRPSFSDASVEDLRETREVAVQFSSGLDQVQNVLLVVVLKFGRAINMMRAMLIVLGISVVAIIWNVIQNLSQNNRNEAIVDNIQQLQAQQATMIRSLMEAKKQVDEATQQAEKAREEAPKVVLDSEGKAKLLVSGDDELKKRVEDQPAPKAFYKKSTPPKVTEKGVEIDLGLP